MNHKFIVSLILSWNYDMSSEGLKKIESEELSELSLTPAPEANKKRELKGSDIIIAVLVVAVDVLALFPFSNVSDDQSINWLKYGIYRGVVGDLAQFRYLQVNQISDNTEHLNEKIKAAENQNCTYFLTGDFFMDEDKFHSASKLYQSSNGGLISERAFSGESLFSLIDSVSYRARVDLAISKLIRGSHG